VLLGYNKSNADLLKQALLDGLEGADKKFSKENEYGEYFSASMNITGPNGKTAEVQSAWIVRLGETKPQLVSTRVEKKKGQKNDEH
jgi:hypothetical protein